MDRTNQPSRDHRNEKVSESEKGKRLISNISLEGDEDIKTMKMNTSIIIVVYIVLLLLGTGTGYLLSHKGVPGSKNSAINTDTAVGSSDTSTFKDSAEGTIEAGGSGTEGSHKLVREGGPSQTAYLVSSVVDLDEYVGKKVRVWGQTMAAKKVSWLMDVGKVEFLTE